MWVHECMGVLIALVLWLVAPQHGLPPSSPPSGLPHVSEGAQSKPSCYSSAVCLLCTPWMEQNMRSLCTFEVSLLKLLIIEYTATFMVLQHLSRSENAKCLLLSLSPSLLEGSSIDVVPPITRYLGVSNKRAFVRGSRASAAWQPVVQVWRGSYNICHLQRLVCSLSSLPIKFNE